MSDESPEDTRIVDVAELRTSMSLKEWIGDYIDRAAEKAAEKAAAVHLHPQDLSRARRRHGGLRMFYAGSYE